MDHHAIVHRVQPKAIAVGNQEPARLVLGDGPQRIARVLFPVVQVLGDSQPGDVHVHMFGTATLSFADGIKTENGDVFEIEAPAFGLPLRNPLKIQKPVKVKVATL